MSVIERDLPLSLARPWLQRVLDFGWATILVGAIAMAATFPGRSQGLALITEPMLKDLDLADKEGHGRVFFGVLSFWGTILGALFCLPVGWLFLRCDRRWILAGNLILLGLAVTWMSLATTWQELFVSLLLTRGFGQSALSVVSITIVAKSFEAKQLGLAMACYAIMATPFYIIFNQGIGWALIHGNYDWRGNWTIVGALLVLLSGMSFLLNRHPRLDQPSGPLALENRASMAVGSTIWQALATPAFWVFSLTVSFWGMISSGISQFNVDIFKERGFDQDLYVNVVSFMLVIALASNLFFGWLTNHVRLTHLLAACLLASAVAMFGLPYATEEWHAYLYGLFLGISSGAVGLIFFATWGKLYGRRDLGRIQGVAQMLTVFASASGPFVVAFSKRATGTYTSFFHTMAAVVLTMAIIACFTPLPPNQHSKEQPT
jgi:MFS family permease